MYLLSKYYRVFTKERHDHYDSREAAYFTVMSIRWGNTYQGKETNTKQKKKKNGQGLTTTIFGISYVTLQIHETWTKILTSFKHSETIFFIQQIRYAACTIHLLIQGVAKSISLIRTIFYKKLFPFASLQRLLNMQQDVFPTVLINRW